MYGQLCVRVTQWESKPNTQNNSETLRSSGLSCWLYTVVAVEHLMWKCSTTVFLSHVVYYQKTQSPLRVRRCYRAATQYTHIYILFPRFLLPQQRWPQRKSSVPFNVCLCGRRVFVCVRDTEPDQRDGIFCYLTLIQLKMCCKHVFNLSNCAKMSQKSWQRE